MASTNSTTHYELSQYVGSDKPTYLVDYNQDMSKIDAGIYAAKSEADTNSGAIGTLSSLTTTAKTSLVAAINEVDSETSSIGDLSSLTTTDKTSLVAAVNEVDSETAGIGTLANLTTTVKTDLVSAVNELDGDIGNVSSLTTTAKSSAVAAINELDGEVGTLSSLTTTAKTNLVAALNEVDGNADAITNYVNLTDYRDLSSATTNLGTIANNQLKIALNSSGTYGKIYGRIILNTSGGIPNVTVKNTGIMGVTESFQIFPTGYTLCHSDNNFSNLQNVTSAGITVNPPSGTETSASITITTGGGGSAKTSIYLMPCIYYFKNFGDVE